MLNYSGAQEEPSSAGRIDAPSASLRFLSYQSILRSIGRHKGLVALSAVAFGLIGVVLSKALPPRYVASAQIYVDPRGLPGFDADAAQQSGDANGFVNYVESLSLIITSRSVLERVVSNEDLTKDSEFAGSLFGVLREGLSDRESAGLQTDSAIRALASRIAVKRPERTYVIDLSLSSRDAAKAARIANATAKAFIDTQSAMRADAARKATDSLAAGLQPMRARVAEAEKKVEEFKEQNGLVGAQDGFLTEQQLAEMSRQLTVARTQTDAARSRYEQVQALRKRGADVGAVAVGLNLPTLTPLRAQQDEARQRVGDLTAELGPRHPLVKDAEARLREANGAVSSELERIVENDRFEYAKAKDFEASLSAQVESLKKQTFANGRALIGLRDVERQAEAARKDFDLFETRSRQTGDIQQVDAALPNIRIVSYASVPLDRSSPPRTSLMGAAGVLFGLAAGVVMAVIRDRRKSDQSAADPVIALDNLSALAKRWRDLLRRRGGKDASAPSAGNEVPRAAIEEPPLIIVGERGRLQRLRRAQKISRIDLTEIGLATLQEGDDASELRRVGEAFDLYSALRRGESGPRTLGVVGPNREGLRSSLAVNLALTASRDGFRVALIDLVPDGSALARAVTAATSGRAKERGAFLDGSDKVLLVLPSLDSHFATRSRPERTLRDLKTFRGRLDLIVCDCSDDQDSGPTLALNEIDDFVALEGYVPPFDARSSPAGTAALSLRVVVRLVVQSKQGEEARRLDESLPQTTTSKPPGAFAKRTLATRTEDRNPPRSRAGLRD
jgi:uncharacterized protein involved in exopolysaccharide biosynthesis